MKKTLLLLFMLSLLKAEEMQQRIRMLMGTYVTVTLPASKTTFISSIFEHIAQIEHSLSTYDADAVLYNLNQHHKVPYDAHLAEALRLSKQYYAETGGYFDVTIGSVTKGLYHFGEQKTYSPSSAQLQKALRNIKGIHIGKEELRSDEGIVIDLGGIGKGFSADKAAVYLLEHNVTRGIIALSGDIRCLGSCEIALQSPFSEQAFALVRSKVSDLSVSTSGTYRRYAAKKSEHHLINPKTASQGKAFISVSLFTRAHNAKIDAYATAVSVMPKQKALDFLKTHKEIGFIVIDSEGRIYYGNLKGLLEVKWLSYKEKATMPSSSRNKKTNSTKATILTHPDTTSPVDMSR